MAAISPEIHNDVLDIARKRHQSGQMCQEVLNLLSKGEITISMSLDEEKPKGRLPIPLVYRPLRQLMYGVLFGSKLTSMEKDSDDIEEQKTKDEETKKPNNDKTEKVKKEEATEEERDRVGTTDTDTDIIQNTEEVESAEDKNKDASTYEASNDESDNAKVVNGDIAAKENEDRFFIKEWCVYGSRDLNIPDRVYPKGLFQHCFTFFFQYFLKMCQQ